MDIKIINAIEWLWLQNGTEMHFSHTIFTELNKVHKFEKLNIKEAQNLIIFLKSKNLIHKNESGDGYVINSLMDSEWNKLLKELNLSCFGKIVNFILKYIALFIVASIGGVFGGMNGVIGENILYFVLKFFN